MPLWILLVLYSIKLCIELISENKIDCPIKLYNLKLLMKFDFGLLIIILSSLSENITSKSIRSLSFIDKTLFISKTTSNLI